MQKDIYIFFSEERYTLDRCVAKVDNIFMREPDTSFEIKSKTQVCGKIKTSRL